MARRSQATGKRGAAAVEMAFVLPVFLLVIFGIVEFGRCYMANHLLASGARLGARSAILEGSTNSQVTQAVKDFCANSLGIDASLVTVLIEDENGTVIDLSSSSRGDLCRITVSVDYNNIATLSGGFMDGASLGGTCTMEHE